MQQLDARGLRALAVERDAVAQLVERLAIRHAAHARLVRALELVARMHQPLGKAAVVGEDDEPVRVVIETAHGIEVPANLRALEQIDDGGTLLGVDARAHVAARLVEQDVAALRLRQAAAVDANVVGHRIGARAELAHGRAVDHHAAVEDQLLGGAARRDARLRQLADVPVLPVRHVPELHGVVGAELRTRQLGGVEVPLADVDRPVRRLRPERVHHHVVGVQAEEHVGEDRVVVDAPRVFR